MLVGWLYRAYWLQPLVFSDMQAADLCFCKRGLTRGLRTVAWAEVSRTEPGCAAAAHGGGGRTEVTWRKRGVQDPAVEEEVGSWESLPLEGDIRKGHSPQLTGLGLFLQLCW